MNGLEHIKGALEEWKIHIDYRFDELHKDVKEIKGYNIRQDAEIQKIKNRKWVDRGASAVGGFLGGFVAVVTFGKFRF